MERYFTREPDTSLTDALAEGLMRTVIESARTALRDPQNYDARAQIMWAGSLSHNGLTGCGTVGDWALYLIHISQRLETIAHLAELLAAALVVHRDQRPLLQKERDQIGVGYPDPHDGNPIAADKIKKALRPVVHAILSFMSSLPRSGRRGKIPYLIIIVDGI